MLRNSGSHHTVHSFFKQKKQMIIFQFTRLSISPFTHISNQNNQYLKTLFSNLEEHVATTVNKLFTFCHTRPQRAKLTTREDVLYSTFQVKRVYESVQVPEIIFKNTRVVYDYKHAGIGGRCNVRLPGLVATILKDFVVGSGDLPNT